MAKRRSIKYPFRGKTGLFLNNASSGLVGGLPIVADPRNPHLTLTRESQTFGRHLTYFENGEKKHISMGSATPEQLQALREFVQAYLVPYDAEQVAWRPSAALIEKFAGVTDPADLGADLVLPPGILNELVAADLTDGSKWIRTTVGKLSKDRDVLAITKRQGVICFVHHATAEWTFVLPLEDLFEKAPFLMDLVGFAQLLRFLFDVPTKAGESQ